MKSSTTASFANRMRDSAESPPFPSLTPGEIERAERKLGRSLTPAEKAAGSLIRSGKVFGRFQPVMAKAATDPFEQEYNEAKKAARAEEIKRMAPAQRSLAIIEDARAERKAKERAAKSHEEKLRHFAPVLEDLERKLLFVRFDESYSYDDVQQLWHARQQILAEGGCPVAAQQMYNDCLATEIQKLQGFRGLVESEVDETRAKLARLEAKRDSLDVALGNKPTSEAAVDQQKQEAFQTEWKKSMDAAWQEHLNSHPAVKAMFGPEYKSLPLDEKVRVRKEFDAYKASLANPTEAATK